MPCHPSLRGVPQTTVKQEAGDGKHLPDTPPMHLPKNSNFWHAQYSSKVKFRLPLPEWTRNLSAGTARSKPAQVTCTRNISAPPSAVASLGEKAAKKGLGLKNENLGAGLDVVSLHPFIFIKVLLFFGSRCTFMCFYILLHTVINFVKTRIWSSQKYLEVLKSWGRAGNGLPKKLPQVFTETESWIWLG